MPTCQFGERQYELACNLELISGSGSFFAPTQKKENLLAVDAAMTPGDPKIWSLLGIPAPKGTKAEKAFGKTTSDGLPKFVLSLFLQFKTSAFLTTKRANEWEDHKESYWRIHLSAHQHSRLLSLEQAVGTDAAVLYAAPKFVSNSDMWKHQATQSVLDNSTLITPGAIGPGHHWWTWSPNNPGQAHSEPERAPGMDADQVRRVLTDRLRRGPREQRAVREHLSQLANAVEPLRKPARSRTLWRADIDAQAQDAEIKLPDAGAAEALTDIAIITETLAASRTTWLLLSVTDPARNPVGTAAD